MKQLEERMYHSLSSTFKIQTTFINVPLFEIKKMITDYSKVKKINVLGERIVIVWATDVEWFSQPLEYLGYQVFPRLKHQGQGSKPISYELVSY